MNKKVNEEYEYIKDIYLLQCICSELKERLKQKEVLIKIAIEYIKKNCIDDEYYINLSKKEKNIIDVLSLLENGNDIE